MAGFYEGLKFVHVLAAITWLGGSAAVGGMTALASRMRDRAALRAVIAQGGAYGQRFAAPAMLLVLVTGLVMVGSAHIGFGSLWILWGLAGMVVHFIYGATVVRKAMGEVTSLASATDVPDSAVFDATRRLGRFSAVYLVVLASVVAAMVLKPTI
jgi:uncharacterized membrane protein